MDKNLMKPRGQSDVLNQQQAVANFNGQVAGAPVRTLDFDHVDFDSTYLALSSTITLLQASGSRHADFVSRAELDTMIREFGLRKIDISLVTGFPYDAQDLDDCLLLLARLQNRLAMQGVRGTSCSVRDILEDTLLDRSHKNHRYDIGEWIEVRGPSMTYRLEMIEDVVRMNDDDDAGNGDQFIYETAVDHKLVQHQIRWPREALRRVFGMAPWAWRQWACVKLENKIRFQEGHPDDVEMLDPRAYALELWELWLADPRNAEFQELFQRVGTSGQKELVHHIMSPFDLMHEMVTNSNDEWELEDAGISMFTYVSLLGSGFIDAFVVFALQVSIPIILFFFYTSPDRGEDEIAVGTREMLFAVLIYYLYKLNRDLWSNFNHIVGISKNIVSRIQSIRRIAWDDGNDSFSQSLGFTVDLFMNTGYICYLYLFNMWILYNVSDPFEILGSVIFFEFLFDLDEEIAGASWWDGRKRYLKAGLISTIMQNTIRRDCTVSAEVYLEKMGATLSDSELSELKRRFDEGGIPKDFDFLHGTESEEGGHLLTVAERVERLRRIESKATLPDEYEDFSKPKVFFAGFLSSECALFERHKDLRSWSQWEIVLFAFPVPNLVPRDYTPGRKLHLPDDIADQAAIRNDRRYGPGKSSKERFYRHIVEVLTCTYIIRSFQSGSETQAWWFRFTRTVHALFAWNSYFIQLCFPLLSVAAVLLVFTETYCYLHLGNCEFLDYFTDDPDL